MKLYVLIILILGLMVGTAGAVEDKSDVIRWTLDNIQDKPVADSYQAQESSKPVDKVAKSPLQNKLGILDLRYAELKDALKVIEEKTGVKIVAGLELSGTVSLDIHDVPLEDALRVILEPKGLAFHSQGDLIEIMTFGEFRMEQGHDFDEKFRTQIIKIQNVDQEEWIPRLNTIKSEEGRIYSDRRNRQLILIDAPEYLRKLEKFVEKVDLALETETFMLKYVKVKDEEAALTQMLSDTIGQIKTDYTANSVTVTDTEETMKKIKDYIKTVDKKVLVNLKAKIYQILLQEEHEEGVDWAAIVSHHQKIRLIERTSARSPEEIPLSIGTITLEDYGVLLEALDTVGRTRSLSEIEIPTIANFESDISLTTEPSLRKNTLTSNLETFSPLTSDRAQDGFNIHFKLLAHYQENGDLIVDLLPQLQWIQGNQRPRKLILEDLFIANKGIKIHLKSDEIIIVGGIKQEIEVNRVAKIPLLGDLPFVGGVFRMEGSTIQKMESVIFISYEILKDLSQDLTN